MNKKVSVGVAVSLIFLAIAITFTATMIFSMNLFDSKVLGVTERAAMYDKITEMDRIVRSNFLYTIDDELLYDNVAEGYITGLGDPNTIYLSAADIAQRNAQETGIIVTPGIEAEEDNSGYLKITKVYQGSSAAQIGLMVGDLITEVEGDNVLEIGAAEALSRFDGIEGTKLHIVYTRDNQAITTELVRSSIEADSVYGFLRSDDNVYYIRVLSFNSTTAAQFDYIVNMAMESEASGLIIDLRDTDGGYNLDTVATMLDKLLPTGTTIRAQYANGDTKVLYTSDSNSMNAQFVLIVNENTKGLAELFAAVMHDNEHCRVVGKTTYGKGTLQSLMMLTDGSGIDLTVGTLLAPSAGSFDETGVRPDFEVDAMEGFTPPQADPDEASDAQYRKAIEIMQSLLR